MAYTARPLSTNSLFQLVNQAHTFQVGHVVAFNGTNYVLASASNAGIAYNTVGMVSLVPDANSFWITQAGYVSNITATPGLIAGVGYFLDPANPGLLTPVIPTTSGEFISLCLVTDTGTSGFFFNNAARPVASEVNAWSVLTTSPGAPITMNEGYFINGVGLITVQLPAIAALGDTVVFWDVGGNGFRVTYQAGQGILLGSNFTTTTTGNASSTALGDKLEIVCYSANTLFVANTEQGIFNGT